MSDIEVFHVSRTSDGKTKWYSARDAATGVSIKVGPRDKAKHLVESLNRAFAHHYRTLLSEAEQREKDARRVPDGLCLVPKELPPEIIQNLQRNTEIGAYVCENMSGAYALMDKYHLALVEASKRALQSEER